MSELVLQRRYGVEDLGEERLRLIVGSVTGAMPTDEIIIFGSYARGEATDESDVDILVLTPLSGNSLRDAYVDAGLRMWDLDKNTDFLVYNTEKFKRFIEGGASFALDVAKDGVVIYGQR